MHCFSWWSVYSSPFFPTGLKRKSTKKAHNKEPILSLLMPHPPHPLAFVCYFTFSKGGGVLILLCTNKFWRIYVSHGEKENFDLSSCVQDFKEILRFSQNEEKNSWVTYIWRGKSHLMLMHKFMNHAHLS